MSLDRCLLGCRGGVLCDIKKFSSKLALGESVAGGFPQPYVPRPVTWGVGLRSPSDSTLLNFCALHVTLQHPLSRLHLTKQAKYHALH
jgi:hypothetical protein